MLSEINPALTGSASLVYSSYFGGTGNDRGRGVVVGSAGAVFVTGATGSTNFPTTTGCFDSSYNGGSADGFLFKLTR